MQMVEYETTLVIRPDVGGDAIEATLDKVRDAVSTKGGHMLAINHWGRKKLAYEVRRERKGTYVYFYFRAPNNTVGELERAYRLEDNIIKFLTVYLEKELVPRRPLEATSEELSGGRV